MPEANIVEKIKLKRKMASTILLKSVTYSFALFGLFAILLLVVLIGILGVRGVSSPIPDNAILTINLNEAYGEVKQDTLLTDMGGKIPVSFADLLINIEMAAKDDGIKAIAAKINTPKLGLAQLQELGRAITYFRSSGKKAYLYSSGFGDMGGGTGAYYLAGAFDKITMLANSEVGLTGMSIEVPFFREGLDRLGIYPEFYARYEHKNAMASFTDKKASKVFYNDFQKLANNINNSLFASILTVRDIKADAKSLMNRSPMSAEEALKLGLVDEIVGEAAWLATLQREYQAELLSLRDYVASWSFSKSKNTIAVLVLDGVISNGNSISNPVSGEAIIGSDTVLAQLREIADDKNIKAVVLRINSPGGSYTASKEIYEAIMRLKEVKQIPVVVSMGDYAASGGYMLALAGDKIYADVNTLTGSIGVLGGKPVLQKLWQKLGVNWMMIETGETSGWTSVNRKFSQKQKKIFNQALDRVYADFVGMVVKARGIDVKDMDKLARGRVWLGEEAMKNKLADEIGGLSQALGDAKMRANIDSDEKFSVAFYPKPRSFQEKIAELAGEMQVSAAKALKSEIGLDISGLNMLKRLQYDAVMMPFLLK